MVVGQNRLLWRYRSDDILTKLKLRQITAKAIGTMGVRNSLVAFIQLTQYYRLMYQ